ncbi:MAG: TRIC cation channel family protein [bacterium]|nr:TRIC cation channel family protein [bacterium]
MPEKEVFNLPVWWDLAATFLFALVGTRFAISRGYDVIGVMVLSIVAGVGGGIVRDLVMQVGTPVVLSDPWYVGLAWTAALIGLYIHKLIPKYQKWLDVLSAVSIGLYGVFGAQKALLFGLSPLTAIFIGFLNAIGGGVLRDVLVRNEPDIFRPGTYFAVAALAGVVVFVVAARVAMLEYDVAATLGIIATVSIRLLAMKYGWKTRRLG